VNRELEDHIQFFEVIESPSDALETIEVALSLTDGCFLVVSAIH